MAKQHQYQIRTTWTGNTGEGTAHYRSYKRDHEISGEHKQIAIPGSSDPVFRGDRTRYNPEELLIGAVSACHMLWMLHLCADAGIVVTAYEDNATGEMVELADGSGHFTEVTLKPLVTITDAARAAEVDALHHRAHGLCAIAASVKCAVRINAATVAQP